MTASERYHAISTYESCLITAIQTIKLIVVVMLEIEVTWCVDSQVP